MGRFLTAKSQVQYRLEISPKIGRKIDPNLELLPRVVKHFCDHVDKGRDLQMHIVVMSSIPGKGSVTISPVLKKFFKNFLEIKKKYLQ